MLAALGLADTHIDGGTRDVGRTLIRDTGATDLGEALALLADNDHPVATTATARAAVTSLRATAPR